MKPYESLILIHYVYSRKMLAAACEKKSVLLFDPITQKYITSIKKAHNDCVNCIK